MTCSFCKNCIPPHHCPKCAAIEEHGARYWHSRNEMFLERALDFEGKYLAEKEKNKTLREANRALAAQNERLRAMQTNEAGRGCLPDAAEGYEGAEPQGANLGLPGLQTKSAEQEG